MIIKYGLTGSQKIDLTTEVNIGSEVKECKDLENFTRDEFNNFAEAMTDVIADKAGGIGAGTESYVEFPTGLVSKTPVCNFDELEEAYRTDFELYRDVVAGKVKNFGNWRPVPKTKKRRH